MAHMQSLPTVLHMKKRVTVSDENGVVSEYTVNDAAWNHVHAVVENADPSASTQVGTPSAPNPPVFRFGIYQTPSIGSLPSAASHHSSQTSFGSTGTQASAGPQNIPR